MVFNRNGLITLTIFLSGCTASFQGRPSPLIPMKQTVKMAEELPIDTAISNLYSTDQNLRNGLTPRQYRDKIIAVYMAGIDARYYNFVISISSQNKKSNLSLSTLALGLSSGASFAGERTANILSAGSSFATGSQSQFNQRLFYEKTLPAIIAGMEAKRNRIKARILQNMRDNDEKDYTIEAAFADLSEYQNSVGIDSGIEEVTKNIAKEAEVQSQAAERASVKAVAAVPKVGAGQ